MAPREQEWQRSLVCAKARAQAKQSSEMFHLPLAGTLSVSVSSTGLLTLRPFLVEYDSGIGLGLVAFHATHRAPVGTRLAFTQAIGGGGISESPRHHALLS